MTDRVEERLKHLFDEVDRRVDAAPFPAKPGRASEVRQMGQRDRRVLFALAALGAIVALFFALAPGLVAHQPHAAPADLSKGAAAASTTTQARRPAPTTTRSNAPPRQGSTPAANTPPTSLPHSQPSSSPPATTSPTTEPPGPTPAGTADGQAEQILQAAILPVGASSVNSLPGSAFAQPSREPACNPIVDKTQYWEVSEDPASVASFLASHAPSWIPNMGSGQSGNTNGGTASYSVFDAVRAAEWNPNDQLDFSVATLSNGSTGIRVDAEAIPPGSSCLSSGSPGG